MSGTCHEDGFFSCAKAATVMTIQSVADASSITERLPGLAVGFEFSNPEGMEVKRDSRRSVGFRPQNPGRGLGDLRTQGS